MTPRTAYRTIKHVVKGIPYEIAWLGGRVKVYRRSAMGELRTVSAIEASMVVKHFERDEARQRRNMEQAEKEQRALREAREREAERKHNRWWRRLGRWVAGLFRGKGKPWT